MLIAIQIARNHRLIDAGSGQAPRPESEIIRMLPVWPYLVSAGWQDSEEKNESKENLDEHDVFS
jgi:hypothetical protein